MRITLMIVLLAAMALRAAAQEDAAVWVASPWQRVLQDSPPGEQTTVSLRAAANEYEPFRLIVRAGVEPLREVRVTASPLSGAAGEIAADRFTFYRAHYLEIATASHRMDSPPGMYPDALIPFVDPQTGEELEGATQDAVPFDVEAGLNQEVWCDLFVPPGTGAGSYTGTVTVTAGADELARVPMELLVWDFELPAEISMRSNFGGLGNRVAQVLEMDAASEEFAAIEDLYIDTLLAHRAIPSSLGDIWPAWTPDGGIVEDGQAERLRELVEQRHVNALRMPFRYQNEPEMAIPYLGAFAEWLRGLGYLELGYVYMKDEPNNAEEYEIVRRQGAMIQEADPEIARMCTEQTKTSNTEWGDLYGAVDIWCPLWGLWDEETAEERLALGERMWSYTALCQGPVGTPWWQIDSEPISYRAPFWTSWGYRITGFLYWSSVYWGAYEGMEGIWNAPHFRERFWGEGMLLYPGQPAGIDGPVTSIRLKLIREAMEDYEYMVMAAGASGEWEIGALERSERAARVDAIVAEVATSFQEWSREEADYEQARVRLAEMILAQPGPGGEGDR